MHSTSREWSKIGASLSLSTAVAAATIFQPNWFSIEAADSVLLFFPMQLLLPAGYLTQFVSTSGGAVKLAVFVFLAIPTLAVWLRIAKRFTRWWAKALFYVAISAFFNAIVLLGIMAFWWDVKPDAPGVAFVVEMEQRP